MKNSQIQNFKKDIEDIRTIHKKTLKVIESCENIEQLQAAKRYFILAMNYWDSIYPKKTQYRKHHALLEKVTNNIDTVLSMKKKRLRLF